MTDLSTINTIKVKEALFIIILLGIIHVLHDSKVKVIIMKVNDTLYGSVKCAN